MRAKFRAETDFDSNNMSTFVKISEQTPVSTEIKKLSYSSSNSTNNQTELILFVVLVVLILIALYFANRWLMRKFNGLQKTRTVKGTPL